MQSKETAAKALIIALLCETELSLEIKLCEKSLHARGGNDEQVKEALKLTDTHVKLLR